MGPVEILPLQETIVLRARGSELLILAHHVKKLKDLAKPRDFSQYFRAEALVNRPARKLFEAWLRKDHTLWPRLYQTVHKEIEFKDTPAGDSDSVAALAAAAPVERLATTVSTPTAPKPGKASAPVDKPAAASAAADRGKKSTKAAKPKGTGKSTTTAAAEAPTKAPKSTTGKAATTKSAADKKVKAASANTERKGKPVAATAKAKDATGGKTKAAAAKKKG